MLGSDYVRPGMWLIHPAVLSLCEQYRIYFKKRGGKYKNWTDPGSAQSIDHSECIRVKRHGYCRISAQITNAHNTSSQNFESVGVREIVPQLPMKGKEALVIDTNSSLFGKVVKMERFKSRSGRKVSQVHDETNKSYDLNVSALTLLEEKFQ